MWAWCRLSGDRLDSLQALKSKLLARNALGSRAELRKSALMVTVWSIWQQRNKAMHSMQEEVDKIEHGDIFPAIQRLVNLWITHRNPKLNFIWQHWTSLPLDT